MFFEDTIRLKNEKKIEFKIKYIFQYFQLWYGSELVTLWLFFVIFLDFVQALAPSSKTIFFYPDEIVFLYMAPIISNWKCIYLYNKQHWLTKKYKITEYFKRKTTSEFFFFFASYFIYSLLVKLSLPQYIMKKWKWKYIFHKNQGKKSVSED